TASLRQTVSGNYDFLRLRALVDIIRDAGLHRLRAHSVPQCPTTASLRQTVSGNNDFLRLRALVDIIRDAGLHRLRAHCVQQCPTTASTLPPA
ncbi:MAG: hypothetical protein VYE47_00005, partial [Pseudomonadota bacterium]|nr:hypothetical protein [Pseudomonadota bacterium]